MRARYLASLVAFCLLYTCVTSAARAQTLEEVLAKNLSAHGGAQNVAALQSLRLTGKVLFGSSGDETEAAFGLLQARPGRVRTELSMQGLTHVEAYDGAQAFRVSPFGGRRDPVLLSSDEVKALARDAEVLGPLVNARAAGHQVSLLGTEEVDESPAIKLRVVRTDGATQFVYLDPDTYLEIRVTTLSQQRGVEHVTELDLGAYEQVGGVVVPFAMDSGDKGEPRTSHIQVERAEANVPVDDAVFRVPEAGRSTERVIVAASGEPRPLVSPPSAAPGAANAAASVDAAVLSGLGARNIGSAAMSGRISALAATNLGGKTLLYVGAASGGVWRSDDGGTTFKPVFDKQPVQSIGALALDPQNPKTVWVGTGEAWTRNSVSIGDGIYRTTDGGETWAHMGLPNAERITRIIVSPKNSAVVYACVPGKLWSDSEDRGLYKTTNGGKSWRLILKGKNLSTGCSSVSMDPRDPRVLFAGLWDFRRKGWSFRSGGEGPAAESGSGLYRSDDAGQTWTPLDAAHAPGLPAAPWGRVEVTQAPSDPRQVYALIESRRSALFYSADGGNTWEERDRSQSMVWRPFYFARLIVDPTNPARVFKPDMNLIVSEDAGRSFSVVHGGVHGGTHGDWHDLWIDQLNPQHIIGGDDGGLWLSFDGGSHWFKGNNLPISQFYHVSVDERDPYQVYGGLQDNSTWVGDSAYPGGITNSRWENLYNSDGFWAFVDPTDSNTVYAEAQGGYLGRVDRKSLASIDLQPKAGYHEKLRFNWNAPIALSPTQRGTLYLGAQFLFRTRDRGQTWQRISGDLTTNDPEKQKQEQSGGITVDNSAAEMHTTIYSISESPKDSSLIWVGTDDGNLQLTRNGGKTWQNVAPNVPNLPASAWVSWVEASRFEPGSAFAAFDRHTFGDMTPWVYKTTDYGATWRRIASPEQGVRGYAHVIRQDPRMPSLLYLGTELGLFISLDDGATWSQFKGGGLPSVAVRDLQIQAREDDLVIATHGRGIWIVDDLAALRALRGPLLEQSSAFLPARPAQQRMQASGGWAEGDATWSGENPPNGAVISYYLRTRHVLGPIRLDVFDAAGKLIDSLTPSKRRGVNRVTWSMRVKPPRVPRAAQIAQGAAFGPRVVPGQYTLRLTRAGESVETKLQVGVDRRAPYGVEERKANFLAVQRAGELFGRMTDLVEQIDRVRGAITARAAALPADALRTQLEAAGERLDTLKKQIVATTEGGAITGEERLREHLDVVYYSWMQWEGRPLPYQLERVAVLRRELDDVQRDFERLRKEQLESLDKQLMERKLGPLLSAAQSEQGVDLEAAAVRCIESRGRVCGAQTRALGERD